MDPGTIAVRASQTLSGFAAEAGCDDGIALESLEPGTTVIVTTRNSVYRLIVIDGRSRHVLVQGGAMFPVPVRAALQGACAGGGSVVKTGWIGVGLNMELVVEPRSFRTSRVQSVTIEEDRPVSRPF